MLDPAPRFRSLALDAIPEPDFADVQILTLPAGASPDPGSWAERIFAVGNAPVWVTGLMALRQSLVGLIGISRGDRDSFTVQRVVGQAALLDTDDRHLRFCCGVAVDDERSLLRVTTAVQFHGWWGRLYFRPVSVLHGPVLRSMMIRARGRLPADGPGN